MAAMINSSVLACNYAISGTAMSELNAKMPSSFVAAAGEKVVPAIRAQQARSEGRRAALLFLAATAFTSASAAASNSFANAGVIDDYLEKSKANKELNDKKRLATSGANFAREHSQFNLGHASSLRTLRAAKILPSKRKYHLSLMI
ncbi:Pectin lyase-like superfamily protein [Prunus dulcis]|uniref:Pectin lyase-like superfamily protein n=1 Tax=Prunus dulcis TaxID=3755 RepID=A0A4Y1RDY1_PRUDU|nr:Pectin lyase-like superfamily protein [Prunus dulcis]